MTPHLTKSSMGQPCDGEHCDTCKVCPQCGATVEGHSNRRCAACTDRVDPPRAKR